MVKKIAGPVCPSCGRLVLNKIGTELRLPVYYYLGRQRFGKAWTPWDNILKVRRQREYVHLQGFYCAFCSKRFPKKMDKEIWAYLKFKHILKELKR